MHIDCAKSAVCHHLAPLSFSTAVIKEVIVTLSLKMGLSLQIKSHLLFWFFQTLVEPLATCVASSHW